MLDYLSLETTPIEEDCVQVNRDGDYLPAMRKEAERYAEMLRNRFPQVSHLFKIKRFSHDFGDYLDVCILFDDNNPEQSDLAYWVESNLPLRWDDEAILEMVEDGQAVEIEPK